MRIELAIDWASRSLSLSTVGRWGSQCSSCKILREGTYARARRTIGERWTMAGTGYERTPMISQGVASTFSVVSVALSMLFLPSHSPERILYLRQHGRYSSLREFIDRFINLRQFQYQKSGRFKWQFLISKLRGEKNFCITINRNIVYFIYKFNRI